MLNEWTNAWEVEDGMYIPESWPVPFTYKVLSNLVISDPLSSGHNNIYLKMLV